MGASWGLQGRWLYNELCDGGMVTRSQPGFWVAQDEMSNG
jgi:hypothetical protein